MLADVDLVAGGVSFPAHRLLLCVSDRLRELLSQANVSQQHLPGGIDCRWKLELSVSLLAAANMQAYVCTQSMQY